MSENKVKLEPLLQRLEFTSPSENYLTGGTNIIRQYSRHRSFSNPLLGAALSVALLVSIGLNLLQTSNRERDITDDLQLSNSLELQASDFSETGSVFRFLCFTRTTVAIDNPLNLHELKGFGEWISFQTPDNYAVIVSLLPLREWRAIGQFEDGIISLQLDDDEVMELNDVGIGPSSLKRGGPFPVYGNIRKFAADNAPVSLTTQDETSPASRPPLTPNPPSGVSGRSLPFITNIVAGVDTELSPLTQKYFGALLRNDECG